MRTDRARCGAAKPKKKRTHRKFMEEKDPRMLTLMASIKVTGRIIYDRERRIGAIPQNLEHYLE
jgi:hypothetical protein